MAQRRSLFQIIFGNGKQDTSKYTQLQMLNGYQATFTPNGKLYDNSMVRACIDAIARNGAKLNPKHIRYTKEGKLEKVDGQVQTLISKRPNPLMNAYDFYYKVISELYLSNNSFIYIQRDENDYPIALYPIRSGMYKLLEYQKEIYIQFQFSTNGNQYTASLRDDVISLKRFYCENDIIGGSSTPITKTMSIKHVIDEGIVNAIKTTSAIRGIIKTTKAMLKPEDIAKMRKDFIDSITDSETNIGGLDSSQDFKEINLSPKTADDSQIKKYDNEVLSYFGISEEILQSKYTEEQWNAFYESVLEPIALMLSLEFTNKVFTSGEKWHGNEIIFEANRLQYASNKTKINLLKEGGALGIFTRNEAREILNLAPVENGDELIQSLNYTNLPNENKEVDENETA